MIDAIQLIAEFLRGCFDGCHFAVEGDVITMLNNDSVVCDVTVRSNYIYVDFEPWLSVIDAGKKHCFDLDNLDGPVDLIRGCLVNTSGR